MEDFSPKNRFKMCPKCGSAEIQTLRNGFKWKCPDCGFDLYCSVASAVGIVIQDGQGRILFERRAKEPRKGFLAFPGGFCDPGETAEDACRREGKEELGVDILALEYLCSFPNDYEYRDFHYKTCDFFFLARIRDKQDFLIQESEVQGLEWHSVESAEDVENLPLAFESARKTLIKYLEVRK